MHLKFKKALVTGGAGFIGSHLVEALLSYGCKVTILDNLSTGHLSNLNPVIDQITFYKNDIRELEILEKAAEGCDVIFHLAAVVSVQQTISDPVESTMINDIGTINVLEAARAKNVRRVVLASSCAIYGDDPRLPKNEMMTPRPASPYAVHKLSIEHYARIYFNLYGLKTVSLRFFNVFGPRQDPSSPYSGVISIFMAKAVSNKIPVIYGDGNQSRDFIYVKDVVKANLLAANTAGLTGNELNVGTGSYVLINRLWELIASLSGQQSAPLYEPARSGDILHSVAGMELTRATLDFKNDYTLEQGLEMTFDWYKGQKTEDI
jgi:nucleoside-diphosphate-sugar epimerase